MRGPYERLKYEFRRTYECPECKTQLRAGGRATAMLCPCQASKPPLEAKWMTLVSEGDSLRLWREQQAHVAEAQARAAAAQVAESPAPEAAPETPAQPVEASPTVEQESDKASEAAKENDVN